MTHEVVSKAKTAAFHRIQTHYLPLSFPRLTASGTPPAAAGASLSLGAFPCRPASLPQQGSLCRGCLGSRRPQASKACLLSECMRPPRPRSPYSFRASRPP
jgi:hypothetical protein